MSEDTASFFSRLVFSYVEPLLDLGSRKVVRERERERTAEHSSFSHSPWKNKICLLVPQLILFVVCTQKSSKSNGISKKSDSRVYHSIHHIVLRMPTCLQPSSFTQVNVGPTILPHKIQESFLGDHLSRMPSQLPFGETWSRLLSCFASLQSCWTSRARFSFATSSNMCRIVIMVLCVCVCVCVCCVLTCL